MFLIKEYIFSGCQLNMGCFEDCPTSMENKQQTESEYQIESCLKCVYAVAGIFGIPFTSTFEKRHFCEVRFTKTNQRNKCDSK